MLFALIDLFVWIALYLPLDIPPLLDAARLDPGRVAWAMCELNRQYHGHLDGAAKVHGAYAYDYYMMCEELDRRYQIWHSLYRAGMPGYEVDYRRDELANVLRLVGPDAYYRAELPAPVPLEWMLEIR